MSSIILIVISSDVGKKRENIISSVHMNVKSIQTTNITISAVLWQRNIMDTSSGK